MTEEWRAVKGWEGLYEVSSLGRVCSLPRDQERWSRGFKCTVRWKGKILTPNICHGYPKVQLSNLGHKSFEYIHRLVCEAFHGPAPEGCEVAHNDGKRGNSTAVNLRWATKAENAQDKVLHGAQPWGEAVHWFAKLTAEQATEIRDSRERACDLMKRFGVTRSTIGDIRRRRSWRHLEAA